MLRPVQSTGYDPKGLRGLLAEAREAGATDLHFKVPGQPRMRVDGDLLTTSRPALTPKDTQRLAQTVLELAGREVPLASLTDLTLGFGVHREGRFRAQIYRQRGSIGVVIHRMALEPLRLSDLHASEGTSERAWGKPGLILVTGRRERLGVLSALVDAYNQGTSGQLLSLESPLEYLHRDARAAIAQREVGVDVSSIAEGLRVALTDDSDAIATTDLPDVEAVELALRIAEAGRPVVAGLAGTLPGNALRHLVRLFPQHREREITERLKAVLHRIFWSEGGALQDGFTGGR